MTSVFYKIGCAHALEKVGQGGLLARAGQAWKGLAPGTQGLVKRLGVGGAGGALVGGLADAPQGETFGGGGAVLGGLLGAGGMAGAGKLLQRGLRGDVARQMRAAGRIAREGGEAAAPAARVVRQEMSPLLQQAESQLIPSISPQAAEGAARRMSERWQQMYLR